MRKSKKMLIVKKNTNKLKRKSKFNKKKKKDDANFNKASNFSESIEVSSSSSN
jgi:hypothetical protein